MTLKDKLAALTGPDREVAQGNRVHRKAGLEFLIIKPDGHARFATGWRRIGFIIALCIAALKARDLT